MVVVELEPGSGVERLRDGEDKRAREDFLAASACQEISDPS